VSDIDVKSQKVEVEVGNIFDKSRLFVNCSG
ncbi:MAG: pur operon repressor, partial [Streptococcus sp.]|nr:pur operon repressor [Streptococcus sp.]